MFVECCVGRFVDANEFLFIRFGFDFVSMYSLVDFDSNNTTELNHSSRCKHSGREECAVDKTRPALGARLRPISPGGLVVLIEQQTIM